MFSQTPIEKISSFLKKILQNYIVMTNGSRLVNMTSEGFQNFGKSKYMFINGFEELKHKYLLDELRVWYRIFLGSITHHRETHSLDYLNTDQKYLFYAIIFNEKINLLVVMFNHLKNTIIESRYEDPRRRSTLLLEDLFQPIFWNVILLIL